MTSSDILHKIYSPVRLKNFPGPARCQEPPGDHEGLEVSKPDVSGFAKVKR